MNKVKLNEFLKDLSFHTEYSFLEQGKDDAELQKVAEKRGIALPAKDLAIFKGKYAFIERTNLNGCSLPKEEVEKSLHTLVGKAIDFDHIRERIVGFWLDAEIIDDTIYAYGAFFKTNLAEDYEIVKELMDKKNLGISFEAYGMREFKDDDTYDLKDIEWAGGALLINTKPAFPGAGVLEMSNQKVLEFANVMTEPQEFIKSSEEKKMEKSRFFTYDMETISRLSGEVICPMCKAKGTIEINEINFKDNYMEATCWMCASDMKIELTPKSTLMLKDSASDRTIKSIEIVAKKEELSMSKEENGSPSIEKAEELIKTEDEIVEKAEVEETIEEVIEEAEKEVKEEEKTEVITEAAKTIEQKTLEVESLQKELATLKEQLVKARDEGKLIGERRSILGDFAKDMSDNDVLDDVKFENASLKKKLVELEAKKSLEKATEVDPDGSLEIGSKDKKPSSEIDEFAKNVRKRAFNL